ncbi:MAG: lysine 2,3-aminomutase, partial [Candidatus Aminicenantes bacterium]|nr:lysine 2,3-aminomutase [Candidatus Aminicenantes bacterium]
TTGFCVPTFVVDAPGGGGKTPVMPTYLISRNDRRVVLRNYEGVISVYTEPEPSEGGCPDEDELRREFPGLENREGVGALLRGGRISIAPAGLERQSRSHLYKKGKLTP